MMTQRERETDFFFFFENGKTALLRVSCVDFCVMSDGCWRTGAGSEKFSGSSNGGAKRILYSVGGILRSSALS